MLAPLSPLALVVHELFNGGRRAWYTSRNQPAHLTQAIVITGQDDPSHDRGKELSAINDGHSKDIGTGIDARLPPSSNDQREDNDGPDSATTVLDSPEYRSSKWMSIAVWLLVTTVTLLASAQLIYIYVGFSDPERLPTLFFATLMTLPASCYARALMGLHIWSETAHFKSGYRHGSRFITWITTPNASHLMMLTAAFGPLGVFFVDPARRPRFSEPIAARYTRSTVGLVSVLGILLGDRNILLGKYYDQPHSSYQTKVGKIDTKHSFVFYEAPSV